MGQKGLHSLGASPGSWRTRGILHRGPGWRGHHPFPSHPQTQRELGGERGSRAGLPLMNTSVDPGVMERQAEMCLVRGWLGMT